MSAGLPCDLFPDTQNNTKNLRFAGWAVFHPVFIPVSSWFHPGFIPVHPSGSANRPFRGNLLLNFLLIWWCEPPLPCPVRRKLQHCFNCVTQTRYKRQMIYSILCLAACLATFSHISKMIQKTFDLQHFVPAGIPCDLFPNIQTDTKNILFTACRGRRPTLACIPKCQTSYTN